MLCRKRWGKERDVELTHHIWHTHPAKALHIHHHWIESSTTKVVHVAKALLIRAKIVFVACFLLLLLLQMLLVHSLLAVGLCIGRVCLASFRRGQLGSNHYIILVIVIMLIFLVFILHVIWKFRRGSLRSLRLILELGQGWWFGLERRCLRDLLLLFVLAGCRCFGRGRSRRLHRLHHGRLHVPLQPLLLLCPQEGLHGDPQRLVRLAVFRGDWCMLADWACL